MEKGLILQERDVAQYYEFVKSLPYTGSGKVDILKLEQEEVEKKSMELTRKKVTSQSNGHKNYK